MSSIEEAAKALAEAWYPDYDEEVSRDSLAKAALAALALHWPQGACDHEGLAGKFESYLYARVSSALAKQRVRDVVGTRRKWRENISALIARHVVPRAQVRDEALEEAERAVLREPTFGDVAREQQSRYVKIIRALRSEAAGEGE